MEFQHRELYGQGPKGVRAHVWGQMTKAEGLMLAG